MNVSGSSPDWSRRLTPPTLEKDFVFFNLRNRDIANFEFASLVMVQMKNVSI